MERQLSIIEIGAGPENKDDEGPGEIEFSVLQALSELEEQGLLNGKYIAIAATLKKTARAVDRGLSYGGKISVATAQLTKQLFDTLDKLPQPQGDTGSVFDTLDATISALTMEALA
ncbi:Uncharacterised protein [Actinobaculum suis]|uniref:Uncharacterized protein n=2 Tax=Actinobaculum suis TaxID=1657 RepID=A0A7Z9C9Y8_9ACTO|nr:Uncharacterised protein [Actinobaculum suis]